MKGKLKVETKGISINLSGEISSEDVREVNKLLGLFTEISQLNQLDNISFGEVSRDLKNNKEFAEIQDKLKDEYEDYHYVKYTKLNKIIEITQDNKKINTSVKINSKELDEKIKTLLDDIEVPNLDFVLVHTSGDLDAGEHEKIYFSIHDKLLEVPSKHIVTKKNNQKVLLEIIFFGEDVVDEPYYDLD